MKRLKSYTTKQAVAKFRCNECRTFKARLKAVSEPLPPHLKAVLAEIARPECEGDCVESSTSSHRCECGSRVWYQLPSGCYWTQEPFVIACQRCGKDRGPRG